ncbi:hypothetical protein [Lactococcus termiticola]|uniref:Uncharacterized protein n=1 Tax=Lactococcus termiticola TaxID=2169526 RepID=A0A2R5HKM9_9LACT|nr:hypothetical protein [Lactococcus termiticola]GBG97161.1 hypothetical protein NtB2_01299 [Lactococcus termiticola]
MKKIPHLLIVLLGGLTAVFLGYFFIILYRFAGNALLRVDDTTLTLYKVLVNIPWDGVAIAFAMVFIYMFVMDIIVSLVVRSWKKLQIENDGYSSRGFLYRYWIRYRTVHLVFILLTIFVTLSLTAPAMVMNSFTAIVSISVLVSNLTKKIDKNEK